jgi:hypothetical protein
MDFLAAIVNWNLNLCLRKGKSCFQGRITLTVFTYTELSGKAMHDRVKLRAGDDRIQNEFLLRLLWFADNLQIQRDIPPPFLSNR